MKRRKLVIGLTGGLGSGKSTVLAMFRRFGARTMDADAIVHGALAPGGSAYRRVLKLFGPSIRSSDGTLDRRKVAGLVFRRPALRRALEGILHPLVVREMRKASSRLRRGVLVLDIPLLFEAGLAGLADRVVVVWAPRETRLRRLKGRISRADALRRMKAQSPLEWKRRRADHVVDNGGPLQETRGQAAALWRSWRDSVVV